MQGTTERASIASLQQAVQILCDTAGVGAALTEYLNRIGDLQRCLQLARDKNDATRKRAIEYIAGFEGPLGLPAQTWLDQMDAAVNELEQDAKRVQDAHESLVSSQVAP